MWIKLGTGALEEFCPNHSNWQCISVRTRREHGVDCVRNHDDTGSKRDLLSSEPRRISRAIEALVVVPDTCKHLGVQCSNGLDDLNAAFRMRPNELSLVGGQRTLLTKNATEFIPYLPNIMQQCCSLDNPDMLGPQAKLFSNNLGTFRNPD